jgi:hypothetical protein
METIHHRLLRARREAGYTTGTEAAEAHGWVVPTYLSHENGSRGVPTKKAKLYAAAYGCNLEWLIDGKGLPPDQGETDVAKANIIRGIKIGLRFAGVRPESPEWHEALAKGIREYEALPVEHTPSTDAPKRKDVPRGRRLR